MLTLHSFPKYLSKHLIIKQMQRQLEILIASDHKIKVFEKVGSLTNLTESWIMGHTSKFLLDFSTKVNSKQIYD